MKLGQGFLRYQPRKEPQPQPSPSEPVLLIHGTFSNRTARNAPETPWWGSGSEFSQKLDQQLLARNSQARTWVSQNVFAWTGDNLESERRKAGRALAARLKELENSETVRRYHLVAHSHGGNVVLNALQQVHPTRLGVVIFLGTPYLRFRNSKPRLTAKRIAYFFYWAGLVASILGFRHSDAPLAWGFVLAFLICIVLGTIDLRPSAPKMKSPAPSFFDSFLSLREPRITYGSGSPYAFVFDADEAVHGLKLVADMARRPRDFFNQFFSPPADTAWCVEPAEAPAKRTVFSELNEMPHARLLRTILNIEDSSGMPQLGGMAPLKTTPAGGFGSGISTGYITESTLQPLVTILRNSPVGWIGIIALTVVYLAVLAPFVIFALLLECLKAVQNALAAIFKWVVLLFGPRSTANYLQQKAFGLDEGVFQTCDELPPGVTTLQKISDELNQRISAVSRKTGGAAGSALAGALAASPSQNVRQRFQDMFTDPALAHTQYYREDEIISAIADRVARYEELAAIVQDLVLKPG